MALLIVMISSLILLVSADTVPVTKIGRFKTKSCSDVAINPILNVSESQTIKSNNLLACGFSCNRNRQCNFAIFQSTTKSCKHMRVFDNTTRHANQDHVDEGVCALLEKIQISLWETIEPQELGTMENIESLSLKCAQVNGNGKLHMLAISHFAKTDYMITSKVRQLSATAVQFGTPARQDIRVVSGDLTKMHRILIRLNGQLFGQTTDSTQTVSILKKNENFKLNGGSPRITVANSIEAVRTALLKGHRRMERHPTRSVISLDDEDIHFDMTETFVINSFEELTVPLYATSIKESVKAGKRYIFRHQINNGASLRPEEEQASKRWVMETSWTKLEITNDFHAFLEALKGVILEGKDVRVLMGNEISTDVTTLKITSNDVIATLPQYLIPFKGSDSLKESKQRVRFPAISASQTLIECEMDFQGYDVHDIKKTSYALTVDWYVTTRNWTKILEINSDKTVVFGNTKSLYNEVIKGKNIRVCVTVHALTIICHGTDSITAWPDYRVVLQSHPIVTTLIDSNSQFDNLRPLCNRVARLISTEGSIKFIYSTPGGLNNNQRDLRYRTQEWFVEHD